MKVFRTISGLFILVIVFSLVGCQIRRSPDSVDRDIVYKGTQGLDMKFLEGLPAPRIYDAAEIDILAELKNEGTSDLSGTNCYAHLSGFDDSIIIGIDQEKYCGSGLFGKSRVYPEGGLDTVEFKTDNIKLPTGVDSLSQKFILTACYDYETLASPVVCIDPGQYKIRAIEEACTVRDVSLSGGQGAPVEVSKVGVDMLGEDMVGYRIHIKNVGQGTVLRRGVSLSGRGGNSCPYNLEYDDYHIVDYDVQMSGGTLDTCVPEQARIVNNQAQVFCKFRIRGEQPYTTPLQIRLRYSYMDSVSKTVEIIKTPE